MALAWAQEIVLETVRTDSRLIKKQIVSNLLKYFLLPVPPVSSKNRMSDSLQPMAIDIWKDIC